MREKLRCLYYPGLVKFISFLCCLICFAEDGFATVDPIPPITSKSIVGEWLGFNYDKTKFYFLNFVNEKNAKLIVLDPIPNFFSSYKLVEHRISDGTFYLRFLREEDNRTKRRFDASVPKQVILEGVGASLLKSDVSDRLFDRVSKNFNEENENSANSRKLYLSMGRLFAEVRVKDNISVVQGEGSTKVLDPTNDRLLKEKEIEGSCLQKITFIKLLAGDGLDRLQSMINRAKQLKRISEE